VKKEIKKSKKTSEVDNLVYYSDSKLHFIDVIASFSSIKLKQKVLISSLSCFSFSVFYFTIKRRRPRRRAIFSLVLMNCIATCTIRQKKTLEMTTIIEEQLSYQQKKFELAIMHRKH
jgi:hypothetical protein